MKLVCVSDTHMRHDEIPIPDGNVLVHAGDMTGCGNWHELQKVGVWLKMLKERFDHIVMIAGNHDFGFEVNKKMVMDAIFPDDIIYLENSEVIINDVKFYGTPMCRQFYNWAFMRDEIDLAPYWANIPDDVNILITHTPAYGILDLSGTKEHCGSLTLYDRIKRLREHGHLKHHIFGHIHASYGMTEIEGIQFHNVASLNEQYRYQNAPQVIEI